MFFKKDKLLEEYENEASSIVSALEQLNQLIHDIKQTNLASEQNGIQQRELDVFKCAVLSIKPVAKSVEKQLDLNSQIEKLKNTIKFTCSL
ncbi:MAG: hypothetical protein ACRC0B_00120 [Legionella sp.]